MLLFYLICAGIIVGTVMLIVPNTSEISQKVTVSKGYLDRWLSKRKTKAHDYMPEFEDIAAKAWEKSEDTYV